MVPVLTAMLILDNALAHTISDVTDPRSQNRYILGLNLKSIPILIGKKIIILITLFLIDD